MNCYTRQDYVEVVPILNIPLMLYSLVHDRMALLVAGGDGVCGSLGCIRVLSLTVCIPLVFKGHPSTCSARKLLF